MGNYYSSVAKTNTLEKPVIDIGCRELAAGWGFTFLEISRLRSLSSGIIVGNSLIIQQISIHWKTKKEKT